MRHSALANSYVRALGCPSVWRLRPLRGRMAPQRSQPGRHARCETEMFGPWTRYCKRRGKGGLKRRIMGRFFFAGCTRVGGRRDGRRRQAEDSRPADGSGLPRPSAKRFLLPAVEAIPADGTRFVRPHQARLSLSPPTDVWGPAPARQRAGAGRSRLRRSRRVLSGV